ncbi:MAG: uroporphyrinogen-III synthase [Alphaproteobacteria bacterium]|nr:uroporphyrinogen-III synthase [Alphaproteobacteria bacterium]
MKPVILITRAIEHATATQKDVEALGADTLLAPLMDIQPVKGVEPISATTSALIITSRNALAGIKNLANIETIPMFIVGKETATLFKDAGFKHIVATAEQSADLPRLIKASVQPHAGALLHITSEHAHTEFYEPLLDAGFGIDQRLVYTADAIKQFDEATQAAIQHNKLSGVLFYSARTADIFNGLITAAGLQASTKQLSAFCLSNAVAAALDKAGWKSLFVAKSPTHQAMMDCLRDCLAKGL